MSQVGDRTPEIVDRNPYIVGNPVTGSEMFFGREDVFEFICKTLIGQHRDNVIILYGQFRTGKTSVLRQMHSRLQDKGYLCIFIDLHSFVFQDLNGFLCELADYILRGLRRNYQKELPSLNFDEFMTEPSRFFDDFLNQVQSSIGDQHILLMLDEVGYLQERVQKGHLGAEIFGYMRHLMQHYEWLNFLFSLGRGMEEMQKEYAILFNVGLYKKISFLARDATNNLISQPVKGYYQVAPAAVERIFHITSGHPYYTQLMCHCLFNSWQRQKKRSKRISIRNVDKVLNEAMELGSTVLHGAWNGLTPGEKTIVAGMAAAMDEVNHAVDLKDINQAWERRCDVVIPEDKMVQAIRSLIACDVILGQDAYIFTVDLQRLWVQKYQPIEWVKEEITKDFPELLIKPIPEIANPFIVDKPVTNSEMFFGREDIFECIRQTLIGEHRNHVIILYGQPHTGKTSVLCQMHSHLNHECYVCIFIDLYSFALEGLNGFLWELTNHILRGLRRNYRIKLPFLKRDEFMTEPPHFFDEFLKQVRSSIGDRHILLMLDEVGYLQGRVQKGHLGAEIFEYLRYLMQHYEWLSFLLALGSSMEEMKKEYAFPFNARLYEKISFLDRDATSDLITQPVKDYYQVEPAAVERIFHITSGHACYTQLVCHCLFNSWQRKHKQQYTSYITIVDVDEVLNEATERGFAVLFDAWNRLTPSEKTLIAGMAAAMGESNCAVDLKDINRAWQRCHVAIPEGKMVQASRNLIACDVIAGQDAYTFTVDLQRLWVQKHKPIELVKQEVIDFFKPPPQSVPFSWPPSPSLVRLVMAAITLLTIVGSSSLFYANYYLPNLQHVSATATAQAISAANANATIRAAAATLQNPYPPYRGILVLNDPLLDPSHGYDWDQASGNDCHFPGDGYHVATAVNSFTFWCGANTTNFSNFVYQAQMKIIKGDSGGLIFRANADNSSFYSFRVYKNGSYDFSIFTDHNTSAILQAGQIPNFHTGLGQSNLLAVMAQDDHITLYANLKYVTDVMDANLGQGLIGVGATEDENPTEVVFTNAKVWNL